MIDAAIMKTRKSLTPMMNESQATFEGLQKHLTETVQQRKNFKTKFLHFCMYKFEFDHF
jgi:hypothetical protein